MNQFDFLKFINNGYNTVKSTIEQYFPSQTNNFRMDKSPNVKKLISPQPQTQVSAPNNSLVTPRPSANDYMAGFSKFGNSGAPIATQSASFAEAAKRLPDNIDPFLPAVIALMETAGGSRQVANNNPFNIRGQQNGTLKFIDYISPEVALLGGDNNGVQSKGFIGQLLTNPAYANFLKTGNLSDFFNSYTPPGPAYGNPSMEELLARYSNLRSLFGG